MPARSLSQAALPTALRIKQGQGTWAFNAQKGLAHPVYKKTVDKLDEGQLKVLNKLYKGLDKEHIFRLDDPRLDVPAHLQALVSTGHYKRAIYVDLAGMINMPVNCRSVVVPSHPSCLFRPITVIGPSLIYAVFFRA